MRLKWYFPMFPVNLYKAISCIFGLKSKHEGFVYIIRKLYSM